MFRLIFAPDHLSDFDFQLRTQPDCSTPAPVPLLPEVPWTASRVDDPFDGEGPGDLTSPSYTDIEGADDVFVGNPSEHSTGQQDDGGLEGRRHWGRNIENRMPNGENGDDGGMEDDEDDRDARVPSAGANGAIGMGSAEFVNLVKAQFDVLASMLDASQIVLFVRRENTETGIYTESDTLQLPTLSFIRGGKGGEGGWELCPRQCELEVRSSG